MGQKRVIAVIFLSLILIRPTWAAFKASVDPSVATASAIAPDALMEKDLTHGVWNLHPTAGYFTGSSTLDGAGAKAVVHGYGATGEADYSFSNHVGVNFSVFGFKGSGTYTPGASEVGATAGSCGVNGWSVGAALVIDPLKGNKTRMPFFIGVNYAHLSSSTPTSPTVTSMALNSPGYTFGFSVRFNVGRFRLEPFLVTTTPTGKGTVQCAATVVSGQCGPIAIQMLPVLGVNIIYMPWNLSLYLSAADLLVGSGVSYYALGPQFTF